MRIRLAHSLFGILVCAAAGFSADLSGTVHRTDTTDKVIAGVKVVFLLGSVRLDSATTDSLGRYGRALAAGTYDVQFGARGYKNPMGRLTRDTMVTVSGSASTLNVNLTPARSALTGVVSRTVAPAGPLANVKVIVGRRPGNDTADAAFLRLDSTITDQNGVFRFDTLIAAGISVTDQPQSRYRLYVPSPSPAQYNSYPNTTQLRNADTASVAFGQTRMFNVVITPCGPTDPPNCGDLVVSAFRGEINPDPRYFPMGDHLILDFQKSRMHRTLSILGIDGSLLNQIKVAPGQTQVVVPASLSPAKGFVYRMETLGTKP